jgi:hypothetical protein
MDLSRGCSFPFLLSFILFTVVYIAATATNGGQILKFVKVRNGNGGYIMLPKFFFFGQVYDVSITLEEKVSLFANLCFDRSDDV